MRNFDTKEQALEACQKLGKAMLVKIQGKTWIVFPSGNAVGVEKRS